jgi:hypothetical protein
MKKSMLKIANVNPKAVALAFAVIMFVTVVAVQITTASETSGKLLSGGSGIKPPVRR